MKTICLLILAGVSALAFGQKKNFSCSESKQRAHHHYLKHVLAKGSPALISHEHKYDVKFVHLNLNLERHNQNVSGNAKTVANVAAAPLDTFATLLSLNCTIDSIRFNGALLPFVRHDSVVKVAMPVPLAPNSSFTAVIYYGGSVPTTTTNLLLNGLNSWPSWYDMSNMTMWSQSESFAAYEWWPCKQILTDKIDSSWVFVTTDSSNKVGSNGLLTAVVALGNKKRFEWKSHKPIDYYLISVAVSKFTEYNLYAKPQYLGGDSILIQNFIDPLAFSDPYFIANELPDLNKVPQQMNFLCNMYGMYPYYKEKYGHCLVALPGGMENQTMSTMGGFYYYISAHELGHQWWGDNVTCKSWADIWINEGFASYTEHLVAEYLDPSSFLFNLNSAHGDVMNNIGGSIYFSGSDTLNEKRIFDGRLTYSKGGAIIHSLRFVTNNDSLWFNTLRGFQKTYQNSTASAIDFQNYYQAQTSINPTQFFNQWYYGEGYPTFFVRYNFNGTQAVISSTQTVSKASVTPIFITPMEYRISRVAMPDTFIRVMHNNPVEVYTLNLTGTVTSMAIDPKNWIINKGNIGRDTSIKLGTVVGLQEMSYAPGITVAPNPVENILRVSNTNGAYGSILIIDSKGQTLSDFGFNGDVQIDLSGTPAGVYLVHIYDKRNDQKIVRKIVKQ